MKKELFRLEYLDVDYNGTLRLEDFSMEVYKGEVLGILTKNTREIDCLADVMKGLKLPRRGRISFKGRPLNNKSMEKESRIIVLSRKSQLIDDFNIADNIFVIRKGFKKIYINKKKLEKQTLFMLKKLAIKIPTGTNIKNLNNLEKLIIEIAKSHILRIPVIVLKSLSSVLSDDEITRLYPYIEIFQDFGQTFIIMDSTSSIIRQLSTRIILLNKGRNLWTFMKEDFSEHTLSKLFKIDKNKNSAPFIPEESSEEILNMKNLKSPRLKSLNCLLYRGVVQAIIDPAGTQIEELRKIFTGEETDYGGRIVVRGKSIPSCDPRVLLKNNIGIISENPRSAHLFPQFNALNNLTFPMGQRVPYFWQKRPYRENIQTNYEAYFSKGALLKDLSNLNSQDLHSLSYLRWHLYSPDLIILIKPFSSVDRQLEDLTIKLMHMLLEKRIGLLILTSNLWELSTLSGKLPVKIQRLPPLT